MSQSNDFQLRAAFVRPSSQCASAGGAVARSKFAKMPNSRALSRYTKTCICKVDGSFAKARSVFCGTSLDDLRAFPAGARRMAGFQLDRVQHGEDPDDWKPMSSIGAAVRGIRVRNTEGAFRVIYVAKFSDAIYCCTASKRRRSKRAGRTSPWRPTATSNWSRHCDEQEAF